MPRFSRRILDLASLYHSRLWAAARAGIRGFSTARTSVKFLIGIVALLAPINIFLLVSNVRATPNLITVDVNTDDSSAGHCTLRAAIDSANNHVADAGTTCAAGNGMDDIQFSISNATITLGSTLPAIANSGGETLTIDGTGQNITISGAGMYEVMSVNGGAIMLSNLTIANVGSPGTELEFAL